MGRAHKSQQILVILQEHPDWNNTQIAEVLGCTIAYVGVVRRSANIPLALTRRGKPRPKAERIRVLLQDHPEWDDTRIAQALGSSRPYVAAVRTAAGIPAYRRPSSATEKRRKVDAFLAIDPEMGTCEIARRTGVSRSYVSRIRQWRG